MEKLENKDNLESEKKRYIYTDHLHGDKVVFECVAGSILEADEEYKKATGNDARKQSYVGCQILSNRE